MSEPTLTEALARLKKEGTGILMVVAALGGGNWFNWDKTQDAQAGQEALAAHYVPALAGCEKRFADQRKICLELLAGEKENTAQWRAQCGGH